MRTVPSASAQSEQEARWQGPGPLLAQSLAAMAAERGPLSDDPAELVAHVSAAKRDVLLRVHRHRLGFEDLEDCSQVSSPAPSTGKAGIAVYPGLPLIITNGTRPVVRPPGVPVFADGQWVLEDLRWTGWGSRVARANGVSSSSNTIPSAGEGRRTNTPARLVLSHPGRINGHRVYRCYRMTVPPPASSLHGCLKRLGSGWLYE